MVKLRRRRKIDRQRSSPYRIVPWLERYGLPSIGCTGKALFESQTINMNQSQNRETEQKELILSRRDWCSDGQIVYNAAELLFMECKKLVERLNLSKAWIERQKRVSEGAEHSLLEKRGIEIAKECIEAEQSLATATELLGEVSIIVNGAQCTSEVAERFQNVMIRMMELGNQVSSKTDITIDLRASNVVSFPLLRTAAETLTVTETDEGNSFHNFVRDALIGKSHKLQHIHLETVQTENETKFKREWKEKFEALRVGYPFAEKYVITTGLIIGKIHIHFAETRKGLPVVLKFYASRETYENAKMMHQHLKDLSCVCTVVDSFEEPGFPPCIVFERGDETLRQWRNCKKRNTYEQIGVIYELLRGLEDIHLRNVVHGDIKPENIVYFQETNQWKFIDFDHAAFAGVVVPISHTLHYVPPEIWQALKNGGRAVRADRSRDLFSIGLTIYEFMKEESIYGRWVTDEEIREELDKGQVLYVPDMYPKQARRLIKNLTKFDPRKRLAASICLKKSLFGQQTCTNERINKKQFQKMASDVTEMKLLSKGSLGSQIDLDISFEQEKKTGKYVQVISFPEDTMNDKEIFMLNIGKTYNLVVRMTPIHSAPSLITSVKQLSIKTKDGEKKDLVFHWQRERRATIKVTGRCNLDSFESKRLRCSSRNWGHSDDKYESFEVEVVIGINEEETETCVLVGTVYCQMLEPNQKAIPMKGIKMMHDTWKRVPQQGRSGIKTIWKAAQLPLPFI